MWISWGRGLAGVPPGEGEWGMPDRAGYIYHLRHGTPGHDLRRYPCHTTPPAGDSPAAQGAEVRHLNYMVKYPNA